MKQITDIIIFLTSWTSIICFTLALFRLRYKNNIHKIVISAILLTQTALVIQSLKLFAYMTIIQPSVFLLCLMLIFRIPFTFSLLMVITVYVFEMILEWAFNLVLSGFDMTQFMIILKDQTRVQALFLSLINLLLAKLFIHYRLGFSFVHTYPVSSKAPPKIMYLFLIVGSLTLAMAGFSIFAFDRMILFIFGGTFMLLSVFLWYNYSYDNSN